MKQKIPTGVVVAAIVIVVVGVLYFGFRTVTGGPNADVTDASIKHWQDVKNQALAHKPTSLQEAQKAGAPVSGGAPGAAPNGGTH